MSDSLQRHGLQAPLYITNSQSLLRLMSIESLMPSDYLILCHPLLFLPSFFPSIRVFANESVLRIRWPKYWSFSFIISSSNEYSGLISFRIDWFNLAVSPRDSQESSPTPQLEGISSSALSLLYGPTLTSTHDWKNHSFACTDLCTGRVTSLLFTMLCNFVLAFFPRSNHLNFMAAVTIDSDFVWSPRK